MDTTGSLPSSAAWNPHYPSSDRSSTETADAVVGRTRCCLPGLSPRPRIVGGRPAIAHSAAGRQCARRRVIAVQAPVVSEGVIHRHRESPDVDLVGDGRRLMLVVADPVRCVPATSRPLRYGLCPVGGAVLADSAPRPSAASSRAVQASSANWDSRDLITLGACGDGTALRWASTPLAPCSTSNHQSTQRPPGTGRRQRMVGRGELLRPSQGPTASG
jgi:hypothetical protein